MLSDILLLLALIAFFAFGYYLVTRLGRFLDDSYRDAFRDKKRKTVVAEEEPEEEKPAKCVRCTLITALHMAVRLH